MTCNKSLRLDSNPRGEPPGRQQNLSDLFRALTTRVGPDSLLIEQQVDFLKSLIIEKPLAWQRCHVQSTGFDKSLRINQLLFLFIF